jgi:biopolymer transport protein ExbD
LQNKEYEQEYFGFLLTPLIDVMLFIIIVLMILYYKNTTHFNKQIIMPQSSYKEKNNSSKDTFVVGIDKNGDIYIEGKKYTKQEFVTQIAAIPDKNQAFYVQADAKASYAHVMLVLDEAKKAHFQKIYLLSNQ